jgi:plasmid stabilization system protein ParE
MTVGIVVTAEAESQVRSIDTSWQVERPAAPALFAEELAATFSLLSSAPLAGRHYRHSTVHDVRRVLLRSSRYHVYYRVQESAVVILAVWSAVRGTGPQLKP